MQTYHNIVGYILLFKFFIGAFQKRIRDFFYKLTVFHLVLTCIITGLWGMNNVHSFCVVQTVSLTVFPPLL